MCLTWLLFGCFVEKPFSSFLWLHRILHILSVVSFKINVDLPHYQLYLKLARHMFVTDVLLRSQR